PGLAVPEHPALTVVDSEVVAAGPGELGHVGTDEGTCVVVVLPFGGAQQLEARVHVALLDLPLEVASLHARPTRLLEFDVEAPGLIYADGDGIHRRRPEIRVSRHEDRIVTTNVEERDRIIGGQGG